MNEKHFNFTTLEQSKLLLDLGLPADSADCFHKRHLGQKDEYFEEPKVLPDGLTFSNYCGTENGVDEEIFDTYEEALEVGIKKVLKIILERGE